ncbi:MAG TPA: hypothetical protein DEG09_02955, partial [Marinilabiliaceae bacterium]|nr:hypothetical protein [Marinilabiliaceae bacterium]
MLFAFKISDVGRVSKPMLAGSFSHDHINNNEKKPDKDNLISLFVLFGIQSKLIIYTIVSDNNF